MTKIASVVKLWKFDLVKNSSAIYNLYMGIGRDLWWVSEKGKLEKGQAVEVKNESIGRVIQENCRVGRKCKHLLKIIMNSNFCERTT